MDRSYPRRLRQKEQELVEWVLPGDRPGYKHYRDLIAGMIVLAEGRRGTGNLVLGFHGDIADVTAPLAPVIAYGMLETTRDKFSITVRECVGEQIDIEIVSNRGDEIADSYEEKQRWTYSTWLPGMPSPATHQPVREVVIDNNRILAVARQERRLWVYDGNTGVNHLIPITNFYNDLMLVKRIRDPGVALKSDMFFEHLDTYSDAELRSSFIAYNAMRRKVNIVAAETVKEQSRLKDYFRKLLVRKR